MPIQRTLVRGGHILSLDPTIGDLPVGDVAIEDDVIAAVAPHLGQVDADVVHASGHVVLPGLIDTHLSVETELDMGMGRPAFAACERHGIAPTLSCDIVSLNSGDLFTQLRIGLGFERWIDTEGLDLSGRQPERLSTPAAQALRWSTMNAADAMGLGDRIGSLTPGKQADVVVVGCAGTAQHPRVDVAGSLLFQTTATDVREVFVAGRAANRDGVMTGADRADLLARAETSAEQVLGRVRASVPVLPPTPPGGFAVIGDLAAADLRS